MLRAMIPFNIELLKLTEAKLQGVTPVTSLDYYETVGGNLHEDGLFSVKIFGRIGDEVRDTRFSYIDLHATIFHPLIYKTLVQLKALYQGIMNGTLYARWDPELKDFVATNELQGKTGYSFFVQHWKEINFNRTKSPLRDVRLKLIEKYKDRAMTDKVLVLPAGLRDIEVGDDGRPVVGEVNTYYRKLLSVARTIGTGQKSGDVEHDSPALNLPRLVMQQAFNEAFAFFTNMLEGKKGFLQNRWGARRIASGTRNVISAMNASTEFLGGRRSIKYTDTVVGLYQMAQAILPVTIFHLRTHYLEAIFGIGDGKARLVDPKTLKGTIVQLDPSTFDLWTTNEGLEKFVNGFEELTIRHKPVMVEDYYLALIYKGTDKTFKIFSDIDELPKGFDHKNVFPLTAVELLYLSMYQDVYRYYGFVTRYPIASTGSTYPSSAYVKTTTVGEERQELDENWEPFHDDKHVAIEFPRSDIGTFVNSLVLSPARLEGLNADFDGDTASWNCVMTDEAIASCENYLNSKNAYVDPIGGLRASSSTLTSELVCRSMSA
jgi:hypothetical protein